MADSRVKDLALLTSIDTTLDSFLVEDDSANITKRTTLDYIKTALGLTGTNSGDQNLFASIAVSGQSTISAGTTTDTLTFAAGSNITITTNAGTKTVTINSTAAGVTDGDKGDITVTGSGATWTIDAGAVTYSKMQNVSATSRILGRKTAGAGVVEELTAAEVLDFVGTTQGSILVRTSTGWAQLTPGTSGEFLRTNGAGANPSWATPSVSASWGSITGTLSSQTDLQSALNAKITAFADPNADRIVFWDDSAGAFAALTASTGLTISGTSMTVRSASDTQTGIVELATNAETQTGTDTARAVTPASLASVGYVTASSSHTFTNKTFDANGTGNSISNLEVADFAASAIVTVSETIGANNNDTTIPTCAAVKAYADSVIGTGVSDGDKGDITVTGSGATWTIDAGAVSYSKIQNVSATSRVLGRKTAGAGVVEEMTASELLDFVGSTQGQILFRGASGWAVLSPGSSGQVLQSGGAGADPSWATVSGGGGLTHFAESRNTSSPNTTVPAHRIISSGAETNIDFVLSPKGSGAILGDIPDSTTTGGNKRGAFAVDLQRAARASAIHVASGTAACIPGGEKNRASGDWAFAVGFNNAVSATSGGSIGESNVVSNTAAMAFGSVNTASGVYSFVTGRNNAASEGYTQAHGQRAVATLFNQRAYSPNRFSTDGDNQRSLLHVYRNITGTSATVLFLNGVDARMVLPATNRVWAFDIKLVAVCTTTGGSVTANDVFMGKYCGTIKRVGSSTTLVGTVDTVTTKSDASMSSPTVSITADDTNEALQIEWTSPSGANGSTVVRASAEINLVEIGW